MAKFLDNVGLTKLVELIKGSLPGKATSSTLGLVKPDNSTITVDSNGILSSNGGGGSSYTFTNGLIESNGTVSWKLNDRIKAGGSLAVREGNGTNASGSNSHAEGQSTSAEGNNSHAEGYRTYAIGYASHAEGYNTQAAGYHSHAEGNYSQTDGYNSHAEGDHTLALSSAQHSEGKFNIKDQNGIFQHIAGNGTSSARSTMFARDWNGNEYLSNNLYVGCNDFTTTANGLTTANAGGSKVATENYVDTAIANLPSGSSFSGSYNDLTDKPTLFSGDYNDLSNKPTIPNAYTLPVASTSTLGGVKVDGSTITIDSNGVISGSGGGSSYTAGDGINIDANGVISAPVNPLIFSMWQLILSGNEFPYGVKLGSNSTWEEFLTNLKAGKVVYVNNSTSYTFNNEYLLNASLFGISNLFAMNLDAYSIAMMNSIPAIYSVNGVQVNFSTYYYFDGVALWSWKNPEDLGNFIKVRYKNSKNTALGYALQQITTDITTINSKIPTAPTTDGTYMLKCVVSSGTPTYSWESVNVGGSY